MDTFALTLFVVCACGGMLSVALLHRWLRAQASRMQPDITLESEAPAAPIASPLPASRAAGVRSPAPLPLPVLDDEPTQPMARTDTSFGGTDFPSTLTLDALEAESAPSVNQGFADTLPMPLETVAGG